MDTYNFNKMVGNAHTIGLMKRMLENRTFPQFTILNGSFGTGKSTSARISAMSLTCDNPIRGNPCGVCAVCKINQRALQTTGESSNVKVVNLGILASKKEINDLIKDVFVLQSGEKARVYIFEEAHVLKDLAGAQTALLEEIDRIPKNTYVLMCTTRIHDIIPELQSRAMALNFTKLTKEESKLLLYRIADGMISTEIIEMIVKNAKGVPRNIINSVSFIMDNHISAEEYREYISDISRDFLLLFYDSMRDKAISTFVDVLEELCNTRSPSEIVKAFKEFTLQAIFCLEGATTDFTDSEVESVKDIFTPQALNKILMLLEKTSEGIMEGDLKLLLYHVRLLMQERTTRDVFEKSPKVASIEKERAKEEILTREQASINTESILKPITARMLSFGDD